MTQVQASNPGRGFVVAVRINTDNTYQGKIRVQVLEQLFWHLHMNDTKLLTAIHSTVTRCDPEVNTLPRLVQHLNANNDFSEFVRHLRKEWQQLANK
jgi:hypothetical protein